MLHNRIELSTYYGLKSVQPRKIEVNNRGKLDSIVGYMLLYLLCIIQSIQTL